MNKKAFIFLLVISLLLSGCQLAKPDAQPTQEKDMLVGVFITQEHLNLLDVEAILENYISDSDISQYSNRVWAEYTEANGRGNYTFPNLEGILLVSYLVSPDGSKENAYWGSEVQGEICEVSFGHHSGDDSQELNLSGTVYFSDIHPNPCLYFNPVYQTADGRLYVVEGQGTAFDGGLASSATTTLKEEVTRTENGVVSSLKSLVTVTMTSVYPARSLVILQMDAENNVLKEITLNPNDVPDELNVDANCAYIILEEHTSDGIRRTLFDNTNEKVFFFQETDNFLCNKKSIQLQWPQ